MMGEDNEESLSDYQLRMLWAEREARRDLIQQDKGFNLRSLISTPERAGLTILFAAQAMGFGPDVLAALAKILGVK